MKSENWKGNYKNVAITDENFKVLMNMLSTGFVSLEGRKVKPKADVKMALFIERFIGIRISDVIRIRPCDLVVEGNSTGYRYRLDNVVEQKTGQTTNRRINKNVYEIIMQYVKENNIAKDETIIKTSKRNIQRIMKLATEVLGVDKCSTHSMRKAFAWDCYSQNHSVYEVQRALNHKNISSTAHYLDIENELDNFIDNQKVMF